MQLTSSARQRRIASHRQKMLMNRIEKGASPLRSDKLDALAAYQEILSEEITSESANYAFDCCPSVVDLFQRQNQIERLCADAESFKKITFILAMLPACEETCKIRDLVFIKATRACPDEAKKSFLSYAGSLSWFTLLALFSEFELPASAEPFDNVLSFTNRKESTSRQRADFIMLSMIQLPEESEVLPENLELLRALANKTKRTVKYQDTRRLVA